MYESDTRGRVSRRFGGSGTEMEQARLRRSFGGQLREGGLALGRGRSEEMINWCCDMECPQDDM